MSKVQDVIDRLDGLPTWKQKVVEETKAFSKITSTIILMLSLLIGDLYFLRHETLKAWHDFLPLLKLIGIK